jgi:hypothetical protein
MIGHYLELDCVGYPHGDSQCYLNPPSLAPEKAEGHLSNLERTIDGFLVGRSHEELLPALRQVNVNPLTRPIVDIGF